MRKMKGFSLLLFLLYLMCFTTITFLFCQVIVSLIIPSFASIRKSRSIIALHIATDLFVRDIHSITNNNDWKQMSSHELVWHTDKEDIGWCFSGNHLIRHTGIYNQGWKHKISSIVATGIEQGVFTVDRGPNNIIGITMSFIPVVSPQKPIICHVAIKEGQKI